MPTVDEFITNDITNPPMIPRELQAVIDKVLSRSTMGRTERTVAGTVAAAGIRDIAAQGLGNRGALERTRLTEAGLGTRMGVAGTQAMEQGRLKEAGLTQRAGIVTKPSLITAEAEARPINQGYGVMKPAPLPVVPPPEEPLSWWEKNKNIIFNY